MQVQAAEPIIDLAQADGATELEEHVQCRLGGRVRDFRLVVVGGGVILRGHTHTYYAKQLAQHAVMERTRLPILANEIAVS
jgi:hypothetical protein